MFDVSGVWGIDKQRERERDKECQWCLGTMTERERESERDRAKQERSKHRRTKDLYCQPLSTTQSYKLYRTHVMLSVGSEILIQLSKVMQFSTFPYSTGC